MKIALIVAAGGSGTRFKKAHAAGKKSSGNAQPSKVFLELGGKPLFIYSLEALSVIPGVEEYIMVVPAAALSAIKKTLRQFGFGHYKVVSGGKSRAESVLNGLKCSKKKSPWVMVHDAARPIVPTAALKALVRAAPGADGLILVSPVVSTMKSVKKGTRFVEKTLDRDLLFAAETPQLIKRKMLEKAYKTLPNALLATDEASLLESVGGRVKVVAHEGWNPKITTPKDLDRVKDSLFRRQTRTGLGQDTHRLVKGRPFYLGGLKIPSKVGAEGHSDGDALLHSITDAILGALGEGDIGDWFSDKSKKYKNIRSEKLLKTVLETTRKKRHWDIDHIDTVITLEAPKLGAYKNKIKTNVAKMLGISASAVSIKAKTAEGLGAEGEGRAVTCHAIVTLSGDFE